MTDSGEKNDTEELTVIALVELRRLLGEYAELTQQHVQMTRDLAGVHELRQIVLDKASFLHGYLEKTGAVEMLPVMPDDGIPY